MTNSLHRIDLAFGRILKTCKICTEVYANKVYCIYYVRYNNEVINCTITIELSQVQGELLQCAKALRTTNEIVQKMIKRYKENQTQFNTVADDLKKKVPSLTRIYFGLECLK